MIFERKKYLDELIAGRGNGLVKIITGVRRCGKSFLLFDIWHNWLLEHGVTDNHIIRNHEIRVVRGAFNRPHNVENGSYRTKSIKGYG